MARQIKCPPVPGSSFFDIGSIENKEIGKTERPFFAANERLTGPQINNVLAKAFTPRSSRRYAIKLDIKYSMETFYAQKRESI